MVSFVFLLADKDQKEGAIVIVPTFIPLSDTECMLHYQTSFSVSLWFMKKVI